MNWLFLFSTYVRSLAWKRIKRWVRESFPTVSTLSTAELAQQLEQPTPPVLIDAREPEEFALSHLPNAYHAQTIAEVVQAGITRDMPVVVYCSIGYRSGKFAQSLNEVGYQATNLEGSIFQWANEDRPLVTNRNGQVVSTDEVHPYDTLWGLLLEPK